MKKQIVVFFAVSLLYSNVHAECNQPGFLDCGTTGDVHWYVSSDGKTLTFSGNGSMGVTVDHLTGETIAKESNPHYTGNYEESAIDRTSAPWGKYNNTVTNVNISEGVTSVSDRAFMGFDKVENISLPSSIEKIGFAAFANTLSLKEVNIPDSVSVIPQACFMNSGLENLKIPNSVVTIGTNAFTSADALVNIVVPDSVGALHQEVFSNAQNLSSIVIGDNVSSIREASFKKLPSDAVIYCQDGNGKHGGKSCVELINAVETNFTGTIQPYTKVGQAMYAVTQNGKTRYYSSLSKMAKGIDMKRIYTIEEATDVSQKTGNMVKIRYK